MNNNVIDAIDQILIGQAGTLTIIGICDGHEFWDGSVVFTACGLPTDIKPELSFARNIIYTQQHGMGVIIFEYTLKGKLRHPRKLLKSVRSKLMRAIDEAGIKAIGDQDRDYALDRHLFV